MKVILYGNEFHDTILTLSEFPKQNQTNLVSNLSTTKGGIHNLFWAFQKLDSSLEVKLYPLSSSYATILYDQATGQRSSLVYKSAEFFLTSEQLTEQADWKHIAYLDHLENLTKTDLQLIAQNTRVSADFCSRKFDEPVKELLTYIQYLFISTEDFTPIERELSKIFAHGYLIVHDKYGSFVIHNYQKVYSIGNSHKVFPCNPLGAGDFFAAATIFSILNNKSFEISLKEAHYFASQMLLK